jgi:hypothetical protein
LVPDRKRHGGGTAVKWRLPDPRRAGGPAAIVEGRQTGGGSDDSVYRRRRRREPESRCHRQHLAALDPTATASPREGDGHLETRSDRERAAAGEHIEEEEQAMMKIDRKKSIQNRDRRVSHASAPCYE